MMVRMFARKSLLTNILSKLYNRYLLNDFQNLNYIRLNPKNSNFAILLELARNTNNFFYKLYAFITLVHK